MLYKLCVVLQGCIEIAETYTKVSCFMLCGLHVSPMFAIKKKIGFIKTHTTDEIYYRMLPLNLILS